MTLELDLPTMRAMAARVAEMVTAHMASLREQPARQSLSRADAQAIVAYLKSLPAVRNKVAGPFGPNEKPTTFVMKIVPPEGGPPATK